MWTRWCWLLSLVVAGTASCSFDTTPVLRSNLADPDPALPPGTRRAAGVHASDSGSAGSDGLGGSGGTGGSVGGSGRGGTSNGGGDPDPEFCRRAANDGAPCDDGLFCTSFETCQAGACAGGSPTDCSSLDDACNLGVCNENADQCQRVTARENLACDDGQICTGSGICVQGVCSATVCAPGGDCDLTCPAQCSCDVLCAGASTCKAKCGEGSACDVDCTDASNCETSCPAGSTCSVHCDGTSKCRVACASGSSCEVDCRLAGTCDQVDCNAGAQCILRCGANEDCEFNNCGDDEDPVECGGGVFACSRACP